MKLTLTEIADRLELNSDTLERWIRQGRIPVKRKGDIVVFNESELKRWAESQRLSFREAGKETCQECQPSLQILSSAIRMGGCHTIAAGTTKLEILKSVVDLVPGIEAGTGDELLGLLMDRERLTSTGIGKGVAIPHPRNPLKELLGHPMIVTCFPETPVDFDAIDNKPVFALFLLLSPSIEMHLGLLSRLSFCLRDTAFVEFLKHRPEPAPFFKTVETMELTLDKKGL
ncbi:MAG: PTS sugar transporter subunit IIA [Pseudomonadota bacterium]